jgi:uncharacterized protein (DUF1919 family)
MEAATFWQTFFTAYKYTRRHNREAKPSELSTTPVSVERQKLLFLRFEIQRGGKEEGWYTISNGIITIIVRVKNSFHFRHPFITLDPRYLASGTFVNHSVHVHSFK